MTAAAAGRAGRRPRARTARSALVLVTLAVVTAVMLVPVYYMLVVASAPDDHSLSRLWFHDFHLFGNVAEVLGDGVFPRYLLNSLVVSGAIAVLDVAIAGAAGYALARLEFPGRKWLFRLVVATLALSPTVVIIPVYVMLFHIGWLNTYQGLIVPGMTSAFGVFLVRQFALGIQPQFLHAARIDGAGELRIAVQVVLPLLRPALLTLLLLQFLNQWDNLLWPLIVSSEPSMWTVPVGLAGFQGEHGISYHLMTAGAVLSAVPPLILFVALQRYYIGGLTLGGLKG